MVNVQVGIPTHRNNGTTIALVLDALTKQSYKEFEVLVVYKPSEDDVKTLDVIEKFSKRLEIKVIEQRYGKVEEAMNLIYSNATSDILLTLDDDNIPSERWVEDHLKFHEKYPKAGVFRGKIKHKTSASPPFDSKIRSRIKGIFYRPYSREFREYAGYLTIFGVPTDRKMKKSGEIVKTITVSSENMSVKREVYKDFRLPCHSIRGFHHEDLLVLNGIKKGYFAAALTSSAENIEVERGLYSAPAESLSTPTTLKGKLELTAEHFLFPYAANLIGYKPKHLRLLKVLLQIGYRGIYKSAALIGLDLAIEGILSKLPPEEIRNRLRHDIERLIQ